jgi:predicted CXXCH cytochrome family protein
MIVNSQEKVCAECHSVLRKEIQEGKSRHAPVLKGECTKCHSPHKAKLEKLLLANSPDMCLNCHKDLKARFDREKVHSPARRDCLRCHKPHVSKDSPLLTVPVRTLCGECHDLKAEPFRKAHFYIDASVMNCVSCHAPHASADPKFFKEVNHPPFAARSCGECHVAGDKP